MLEQRQEVLNTLDPHQGLLNDREISFLCQGVDSPMLDPFIPEQRGKPSYGLGSMGYDLRLGQNFLVHKPHRTGILDPLNVPSDLFEKVVREDFFILQPHSQVLAETVERFNMPDDVLSVVLGKSTYARLALLVNTTPAENAWCGILTLELANLSPLPIKMYVGQGIAQALFFRGNRPLRAYDEKESGGQYQNQEGVMLPK